VTKSTGYEFSEPVLISDAPLYRVTVKEFPDFYAEGDSEVKASENAEEKLNAHLDFLRENQIPAPLPHAKLRHLMQQGKLEVSFPYKLAAGTLSLPPDLERLGMRQFRQLVARSDITMIVGLNRGGKFIAGYLEKALGHRIKIAELDLGRPEKLWKRRDSDWHFELSPSTKKLSFKDKNTSKKVPPKLVVKGIRNNVSIKGEKILIVDDIIRSGKSMEQASRILSGKNEVYALALATNTEEAAKYDFALFGTIYETANHFLSFTWSEHPLKPAGCMHPIGDDPASTTWVSLEEFDQEEPELQFLSLQ